MSHIKVLHAITMLELGGAQRNTLDTVRMLDRSRFEVGLACADTGEYVPEARTLDDVALFLLPHLRREVRPIQDWRALREIRQTIRSFHPAILHTHSSKAGILGRLAARLERVPIVIHSIHGFGFGRHQSWPVHRAFLAAEQLVAPWTSYFIAVSSENLDEGVKLGLFGRDQVRVIRSGIDLMRFRKPTGGELVRAELGIPPDAQVVLQVSCFKPQKAPERFVALAERLAGSYPNAHFVLVGDGELRGQLESLRDKAGLQHRLHLPSWRPDVPALLDAATLVTLTSRFEGLPRALVEALAAGRPVVAMAVDGVVEVVRDGVNGFVVAEGDGEALAARVGQILGDTALHTTLAANAPCHMEEFDHRLMVTQQEELYGELAS